MRKVFSITEAEWQVMKVLWKNSYCHASKVIEELEKTTGWKPTTVKTLLSRLVKKKVVTFRKENNAYIYTPTVSEEECQEAESESFLNRLFNGSCNLMVSRLIHANKLTGEDIQELRLLLDKLDGREKKE